MSLKKIKDKKEEKKNKYSYRSNPHGKHDNAIESNI